MAGLLKEEREHVDHASGVLLSTSLSDNFTLEAGWSLHCSCVFPIITETCEDDVGEGQEFQNS